MNDTTFQGDGKVAYVPVVVNAKLTKPSNADRIRAMTDEELALYFAATFEVDEFDGTGNSYKKWLGWLRQEAI